MESVLLPEPLEPLDVELVGEHLVLMGRPPGDAEQVVLWYGQAGASVRWVQRMFVPLSADHIKPRLHVDASDGTLRVAVSRVGWDSHDPPLVAEWGPEGWGNPALLAWPLEEKPGTGEFPWGSPLILRGTEILTLSNPNGMIVHGEVRSEAAAALLRYRKRGHRWKGAMLPFPADAHGLWWNLKLSPDGQTLATTTRDAVKSYSLQIYKRSPEGSFDHLQSVPLSATSPDSLLVFDDLIVLIDQDVAVVRRLGEAWEVTRRVTPPPKEIASALSLWVAHGRIHVSRVDGAEFLFDPDGELQLLDEPPEGDHPYWIEDDELFRDKGA